MPAVPHPPAMPCCEEPGSIFSAPSSGARRLPLAPCRSCLQAEQAPIPQPLLMRQTRQCLPTLVGVCWTPLLYQWATNRLGTVFRWGPPGINPSMLLNTCFFKPLSNPRNCLQTVPETFTPSLPVTSPTSKLYEKFRIKLVRRFGTTGFEATSL